MGVDRDYQAISPWSTWVLRAREDWREHGRDAPIAEGLVYFHNRLVRTMSARAFGKGAKEHPFVLELIDRDPGIIDHYFDSNRYFDALHFVLSESRRTSKVTMYSGFPEPIDRDAPDYLFDLAMLGDEVLFGENVHDGQLRDLQGMSVRYLSPTQVRAISVAFASVSKPDLEGLCSRAAMELAFVYKPLGNWSDLERYFDQLRAFYIVAATGGEGVIVSTG